VTVVGPGGGDTLRARGRESSPRSLPIPPRIQAK